MVGHGPLAASQVVGAIPLWSEPRLQGGRLFWLERRPQDGGRTRLLMRPAGPVELPASPTASAPPGQEITPAGADVRSRIHAYGGGAYAVGGWPGGLGTPGGSPAADVRADSVVVWVDDGDRCLWRLDLPPLESGAAAAPATGPKTMAGGPSLRLTEPDPERRFADGLIDPARGLWIGVLETGDQEALVSVPLAGGEPQLLRQPADFCGYAVLSPSGSHLAWIEWLRPAMPWERSQLWLGRLTPEGSLTDCRPIAGSMPGEGAAVSVFQPLWIPREGQPADLVVSCDRSGWWNLERLEAAEALGAGEEPAWQPLLPLQAEFGMPQWVYGMATTAWDGEALVAAACFEGRWHLGRLVVAGGGAFRWQLYDLRFDDLAAVVAERGRLVAIAASPSDPAGLLELDTASGRWRHTPAAASPLSEVAISHPEPLWFEGHGGRPTQAWYYPPRSGSHPGAPLLVKGHSGPTGMARTGLNLAIQFWTSRGWGVVDVNYGGSTGFGRAYRERLDGQWGVVDGADCAAAAAALVAAGRADSRRIAIEGGSAAGFTVLAALCGGAVFRAGACRYAVADLEGMARHTHRFEARYFDGLVGPWPEAAATYRERSPLLHADRIRVPVIFFQGLEDAVVPPDQTERMALALGERGIPVEVHLFPGEGHGFRDRAVQQRVLEATEAFFRRHLDLP
ncbi:alpha/beta hydrolase family protein [Vulcanococcus limneticus]|uniref:alpha/beta hydrolase family protein n=1 Tax=Vulcanococcus limneticus TaxID=2170428 RepID=UPI00398BEBBA